MSAINAFRTALFVCLLSFALIPPANAQYPVTFEGNIAIKMRDGVTLRADIYRPNAEGKFPVLLQRTPYSKYLSVGFGLKAAAQGYVVIVQDVRGRYASEGEWYPLKNEPNDGYDTIEWAAALPYSDGRVGMFGGSYVGATQLLAAIAHPPHLAGICPAYTQSDYYEDLFYTGGAFGQWVSQSWTSFLIPNSYEHFVRTESNPLGEIWKLPEEFTILDHEQQLSLASTAIIAPYYLDWLAHPTYDDYWKRLSIAEHFSDITVPALHITAW